MTLRPDDDSSPAQGGSVFPPPGYITTGDAARRFGVRTQTVRNWRAAGMPAAGTVEMAGGVEAPYFDPAAADAWVRANRGANVHGSSLTRKRRGAGRKRKDSGLRTQDSGLSPEYTEGADRARLEDEAAKIIGRLVEGNFAPAHERLPVDGLLNVTPGELQTLARLDPRASGWDPNAATRFSQLSAAQKTQLAVARERGELAEVGEVRKMIRVALEPLAAALKALAQNAAATGAAELGLDGTAQAKLKAALAREVGKVMKLAAEAAAVETAG